MPRPTLLKTTAELAWPFLIVIVPLLAAILYVLHGERRHDNKDP